VVNRGRLARDAGFWLLLAASLAFLLFPLVGFLLPWGVTKSIAWIATGFTAPKGA